VVIAMVAALSLWLVYPTLRWMSLSDDERADRLAQWQTEDAGWSRADGVMKRMGRSIRRWGQGDRNRVINLGLDLQGGIDLRYQVVIPEVDDKAVEEDVQRAVDAGQQIDDERIETIKVERVVSRALTIIRNRVDMFGTTEPVIQQSGKDRIYIQLPGEKDPRRAKEIIGRTAQLEFRLAAGSDLTEKTLRDIDQQLGGRLLPHLTILRQPAPMIVMDGTKKSVVDGLLREADEQGLVPEKYVIMYGQPPERTDATRTRQMYLIEKEIGMTGEHLVSAKANPDRDSFGDWMVNFQLDAAGSRIFAKLTKEHVQERLAIVLDNSVQSAPTILDEIPGGRGQITGSFTPIEARDLEIVLQSGALPAPLELIYEGSVGPTLGRESIRGGVTAGLVGLLLVIVFMLVYYRLAGIIAIMALLLNVPIVLGALAYFHATLTLPGIAGFVLTIGMAVDANVLIFERLREELRKGKTIRAAIDTGYARAFLTIVDSNLTTLIAALVLFQFGTGPIKGFAVTLSIGILSSMFTALFFTRIVFDLLTRYTSMKTVKMMTMIKETHIPFVYWRHVALTCSVILLVVGMTAFGIRGKDNLGVDFSQGMVMRLRFDEPTTTASIQEALISGGLSDTIVQESVEQGGSEFAGRDFVIRARTILAEEDAGEGSSVATSDQIERILRGTEGLARYELLGVESIGAAVSKELTKQAFLAIMNATFAIIIYISIRFHFKFALGGVIALFHDMLITLGIFALTGREISLPVVAALLTIMGYSINDTIVIFDRIREDMKMLRGRDLAEVMNISINETLSRTALTSLTTLIAVVSILLLGGAVIHDFAFALTIGVVVGTYSSMFVAAPVVLMLTKTHGVAAARDAFARGSALTHLFEKLGLFGSGRQVPTTADRGKRKQ